MPYGIDQNLGGDSEENIQWMEHCINQVMNKSKVKDKSTAIAICKAQLRKSKGDRSKAQFYLENEFLIHFK